MSIIAAVCVILNLMQCYSSHEDMKSAVLIAARKGDGKIVRAILEEDIFVVDYVLNQALEEGLTSFFEVKRLQQYTQLHCIAC